MVAETQEPNLEALALAEQERLNKRKEELETELSLVNKKLARINRFFEDDEPQRQFQLTAPNSRRVDNRHPRGFVQQTVWRTVTEHPQGLTRAELIKLLAEEKIGEQSISNALGALTDAKKITAPPTRGGKYLPASAEIPTAPDQPSS